MAEEKGLQTTGGPETIEQFIKRYQHQIITAMPTIITADRMLRIIMTAIRRNPKLMECDRNSLIGAIIESAQLGLSLDTNLGEASLVPFAKKVQLIPGYRGLIKLALQSGDCSLVEAHEVYSNDLFQFQYGTESFLKHQPVLKDRGEFIGAYCIVQKKDGSRQFHLMSAEQIEAIQKKAPGSGHKDSAWQTNPDEMRRKTPTRNLLKYVGLSPDVQKAATLDMLHEAGIDQHTEDALGGDMQTLTEQRTEDLKDTLKEQQEQSGDINVEEMLKKAKIKTKDFHAFIRKTANIKEGETIPPEAYEQMVSMLQNEPETLAKSIAKEIKEKPAESEQQELIK